MAVSTSNIESSISTKELLREYSWYKDTFSSLIQGASDDFFTKNFRIEFIGLSKNINCLLNNESCFVTKIKINEEYDMFFRLTEKAINIILDKVLGKAKNKFNINKISELEAKIITAFNGYMYDAIKPKINQPDPKLLKRNNFDMINMTFILRNIEPESKEAGKIIVTLPLALLSPEQIESAGETFKNTDFPQSEIFVKVIMGKTKFSLYDIKNLEQDDVVVFENSDIQKMKLSIQGELLDIHLNPNMDLLIPEDSDNTTGGNSSMSDAHNIWDSIEVDMDAEFDAVKISLKELKNIEEGLVVDLTSLYDNNVTLKVEGKPIASGTLVIVNDRYGVKINKVIAASSGSTNDSSQQAAPEQGNNQEQYPAPEDNSTPENTQSEDTSGAEGQNNGDENDEDFDYSDFELEDENL